MSSKTLYADARSFVDYMQDAIDEADGATQSRWQRTHERIMVEVMQLEVLMRRLDRARLSPTDGQRLMQRFETLRGRLTALIRAAQDEFAPSLPLVA